MLPKEYHLNASALFNLDSFCLSVSFILSDISDSTSLSAIALIDSGSSYYFIDLSLVKSASLYICSILQILL